MTNTEINPSASEDSILVVEQRLEREQMISTVLKTHVSKN